MGYRLRGARSSGHRAARRRRWFEIIEERPFRTKSLRAALRERDLGTLTVKKRGVDIVPERLIAQLKATGSIPATLLLTRVDGKGRAFWVRPID